MNEMVCGFFFSRDGQRVALVRKGPTKGWQAGRFNGVGGKVEPGETPVAAMVREFREEAGVATAPGHWTHCVTLRFGGNTEHDRRKGGCVYFFRATAGPDAPADFTSRPDEPVGWYLREILPLGCVGNAYWLVPLCFARDVEFPIEVRDVLPPEEWGKGGPAA
jgi:8-oxo-dGTP diphosphatase